MTSSKLLALLSVSFAVGVFFSLPGIMLGFLFMFFIYLLFRSPIISIFCLLFFLIGAIYFTSVDNYTPHHPGEDVQATVISVSHTRSSKSEIVADTGSYRVLLFLDDRHTGYRYGDIIHIKGHFRKPEELSYTRYLKKEGVYYTSYHPMITLLEKGNISLRRALFDLKTSAKKRARIALPPPQVFLLEAVLMGDRGSLTAEMNERLSIAGVRHIVAVSGMHIVILSSLVFSLLFFLGASRKRSSLIAILFIIGFVFFVGAPASAVRAGIMGSLLLISRALGSAPYSPRSVIFAGALMLLFNPLLIRYDIGFQLSFLAVLGIIYLSNPLKRRLSSVPAQKKENRLFFFRKFMACFFKKNESLRDMVCTTLSAIIFTSPLILYNFGNIPLLSVFTNVVVIPLLPFIFIFGVLSVITASSLVAFPVYILLSFVLFIANTVSSIPFAALQITNVPFLLLPLFYIYIFHRFKLRFFI